MFGGVALAAFRLPFAIFAADSDGGYRCVRVGDVLRRELRYVLRVDHFDDGVRLALVLHVLVDRLAIGRNDDGARLVGLAESPFASFSAFLFLSFFLTGALSGAGAGAEAAVSWAKAMEGVPT